MSKVNASTFNLRDRFGDWWDGTSKLQRSIFRVVLIGFGILLYQVIHFKNGARL